MPSSKDKDVEADDRSREKRHRSSKTTDRKERDGEKEKHREKDKERDRDKDKAKDRDRDRDWDRERRHRDRDNDRDNLERDKDSSTSHRHRSSRSSKVGPTDSETHSRSHRHRRVREMDKDEGSQTNSVAGSSMTDLVPELRRGLESERGSLPYPSFSKAHSKESLLSRVDVTAAPRRTDPLTPEATDLGGSEIKRSKSVDSPPISRKVSSRKESRKEDRPPSPPETDLSSQKKRSGTPVSVREEELRQEERPHSRESSRVSRSASIASQYESKSKVSRASSQRTFILQQHIPTRMERSRAATAASEVTEASTVDSGATSVTQSHHSVRSVSTARPSPTEADSSPESAADSSPKTPMTTHQFPPPSILPEDKSYSHYVINPSDVSTPVATPAPMAPPPPPPPPPPPLFNMQDVPRVDYLMQNGGLPTPVPRQFLAVLPKQNGTRPSIPPLRGPETLFAPFFNLLNQYQSVLSGNGSVAVATGHRTVARRLLDRLENVFSRDLSSDGCSCVMCDSLGQPRRGLGWGEVLERVSGRVDLPQWPPFDLALIGSKAAEDLADIPVRPASPIKMDPDIAEEFREHYLRQTKRVRVAVDKWMSNCDKAPAPPPQEVDDETLTFAILTNLESSDRPFFNALLSGSRDLHPATRAPTPLRRPRNDFVVKMGLSLQRLYRLHTSPRDAETAVYLVKNPALHDLLHTISEINPSEWEILTSGRFDGFLWSGAEDDGRMQSPDKGLHLSPGASSGIFPHRDVASPGLRSAASPRNRPFSPFSRGPTPGTGIYSRGPTPASFISGVSVASSSYPSRAAVSHDEETEIAVLAELEREIFNGMEALEDAFEKLHDRAMTVRDGLRRRGAALSMGLQQRRGANGVSVLPLSGSSGVYDVPVWADDESTDGEGRPDIASDWGDDQMSELAPDDSASQISSNRHRRQTKRRKERATPAPIEEEEEG